MKKFKIFAMMAVVLTIFGACQKDELIMDEPDAIASSQEKSDVYVENGYLAFKNMNAVDSVISVLNGMTREERDAWDSQMGFKSARADFNQLFDEYEQLESKEEFFAFKQKYQDRLTFSEEEEDASIDYPFIENYFNPLLNTNGEIKIGKSIIKYFKKSKVTILDGDLKKLSNVDDYSNDPFVIFDTPLKSSNQSLTDNFPDDNPFGSYDRWWADGKKRLLNELWIDRNVVWNSTNHYVRSVHIYFKQRAQKKSWGSWNDYKTQYAYSNGYFKYGNITTRRDIAGQISNEVRPSATLALYNNSQSVYTSTVPTLLPILDISWQCNSSYRGFHYTMYPLDHIEHSGFPDSGQGWNFSY